MKIFINIIVICLSFFMGCLQAKKASFDVNTPSGLFLSLFAGIATASSSETPAASHDIYVGGYYLDVNNTSHPAYWKNNIKIDLPLQTYTSGQLNAIYAMGNSVFAVGFVTNASGISYPAYWINGILTVTTSGSGSIQSVHGNGVNVYAVGSISSIPKYWNITNGGTITNLPSSNPYQCFAESIFVSSANSLYIAGSNVSNVYGYWLPNNSFLPLTPPPQQYVIYCATSIYGNSDLSTIYVAGYVSTTHPFLWVNGTPIQLSSNNGATHSVFVTPTDEVYTTGWNSQSATHFPGYWKGAIASAPFIPLSITSINGAASGETSSIFVDGADVHVVGTVSDSANPPATYPMYWKNGTAQNMEMPTGVTQGKFTSVVVGK